MVTVTSVDGGTVVIPKNVDVETRTEEVLELVLVGAAVVVSTTVEVEMGTEGILELELVGTTTIVDVETGTEEVLELELVGTTTTVDVEVGTEEVLDLDLDLELVDETVSVEVTKTVDVTVLFMFGEELLLETVPGCSIWEQRPKARGCSAQLPGIGVQVSGGRHFKSRGPPQNWRSCTLRDDAFPGSQS